MFGALYGLVCLLPAKLTSLEPIACFYYNYSYTGLFPIIWIVGKERQLQVNCQMVATFVLIEVIIRFSWSQWPRGLRRGSAAASLLGLWVRILPEAGMSVAFECCLLSDRGLCVELITRPEEFYRVSCVWVWSWSLDNEEALAHWGCWATVKKLFYFASLLLLSFPRDSLNSFHVRRNIILLLWI